MQQRGKRPILLTMLVLAVVLSAVSSTSVWAGDDPDRPGVVTATNVCIDYLQGGFFSGPIEVRPPDFVRYRYVGGPGPGSSGDLSAAFLWLPNDRVLKVDYLGIRSLAPEESCAGVL